LLLPSGETGRSILPGKVISTQVEALAMVCAQVMGHDAAVGFAASQGQFELNVFKPLIVLDTLDSMRLLADAMRSFSEHCVAGLLADPARLRQQLRGSLMLASALSPHIGTERSAQVAQEAQARGCTLREAAIALGAASAEEFDAWVNPRRMLGPHADGLSATAPRPPATPAAGAPAAERADDAALLPFRSLLSRPDRVALLPVAQRNGHTAARHEAQALPQAPAVTGAPGSH
jgi:fumarate hydratase class II